MHDLRERVETERLRAARAAASAARHERLISVDPPSLRDFHRQMATVQRRMEHCHLAAAQMHASCALRLYSWIGRVLQSRATPLPTLMDRVAMAAAAEGASVTLFTGDRIEVLTAASEGPAQRALDLESVLGEGPARDTMTEPGVLRASGPALEQRWPNYGAGLARLGIGSLVAVPIEVRQVRLGALTVYEPRDDASGGSLDSVHAAADLIALLMNRELELPESAADPAEDSLFTYAEQNRVIHQATGMVSAQMGCSTANALALIRARAFADGRRLEEIATDVVDRTVGFG
jgi:hypothetical protein